MKEHEQDLEFSELDMESTDGFNTDHHRFKSIAFTCKTLLDELDEEYRTTTDGDKMETHICKWQKTQKHL